MRSLSALLTAALALVLASVVSVAACSSTTSSPGDQTADAGTGADAGKADPDAASSDAASSTLQAPTITMVMPMTGGLHVVWTNKQTDCDAIEGERKSAAEPYKVVFTVPDGSVDNNHDAPLTAGTAYTYRLRCKKGSSYSPYSNEKSGTP